MSSDPPRSNFQMRQFKAMSKRERFHAVNTLSSFIMAMRNNNVEVEMKNGSVAKGLLFHSDGFGNMTLKNAKIMTIRGRTSTHRECTVKVNGVEF